MIVLAFLLFVALQEPAAPQSQGSAILRGRVTDQATGLPIARAIVTVTSDRARANRERPIQVRTESDGTFEVTRLSPGMYSVRADLRDHRATHLGQTFGERRPYNDESLVRLTPLILRDGEVRDDINIALRRALAIEGRVVDELGVPMAHVALDFKSRGGGGGPTALGWWVAVFSDDRGFFRLFGLMPGKYVVCANPQLDRVPTESDHDAYVPTCHPSATAESDALPVTVTDTDVSGVEIRVKRNRIFTVTGIALDSGGAALTRGQLQLLRLPAGQPAPGSDLTVQRDGRFVARGLTPGDYVIRAEVHTRYDLESTRPHEIGFVPLRIDDTDVEGLLVMTLKTARIAGRVVFAEEPTSPLAKSIRLTAIPEIRNPHIPLMGPPVNAQVKPDLTFEFNGLYGPRTIQVSGLPGGWIAKSIKFNGEEIIDTLHDFTNARASDLLEIVVSSRGARVSGRVLNDRGEPTSDATVMLLPADPAKRKGPLSFGSVGASSKPDGSYQLGPVRAGEYLILALGLGTVPNAQHFERLVSNAERITLVDDEQQSLDLRIAKLRGP